MAIPRTYGGSEWLVSECVFGVLRVSAATGNVEAPYYFTFSRPDGATYQLDERTTTPSTRAHAAHLELSALSPLEIAALVAAVRVNACRVGQVRSCNPPFR